MGFCLPFNKLAFLLEMVSGTRGQEFKSPQARHHLIESKHFVLISEQLLFLT